jgi:hypothetical protein
MARRLAVALSIGLAGCGLIGPDAATGWQPPMRLGPTAGANTWFPVPSVASDAEGRAIVVWTESPPDASSQVMAAHFDGPRQWGPPLRVGRALGDLRNHVVMNARGQAAIAASGPTVGLFRPGAVWSWLEMPLSAEPLPAVALAENGAVTAVWQAVDYGVVGGFHDRLRFWGATVSPAGWEVPQVLAPSHAPNYRPLAIGVDGRGAATAVWLTSGPPPLLDEAAALWSIRFVPGTGWGAAARLAELPNVTDWAQISVDLDVHLDGNAAAIWQGPGGVQASLYGTRGWSTPVIIGGEDVAHPRVRVLAGGRAIAAWESSGRGVEAVTFDEVGGWTPPRPLDGIAMPDAGFPGHGVDLGVDRSGRASIVWVQNGRIRCARFSAREGWETAVSLQSTAAAADSPQIAVTPGGRAFAVWAEQPGPGSRVNEEIWAAVYVPPDGP